MARFWSSRSSMPPSQYQCAVQLCDVGREDILPSVRTVKVKRSLLWRINKYAATYCVIIQTQRTQISGRNSNGTKHSGGPPEDGREKRPKHVGVLYLQTLFLTFYWL